LGGHSTEGEICGRKGREKKGQGRKIPRIWDARLKTATQRSARGGQEGGWGRIKGQWVKYGMRFEMGAGSVKARGKEVQ